MAKRIAYVTGGMGGIGTAICQRLHKDGLTVVAGCGANSPRRERWLAEQAALGYSFIASEGNRECGARPPVSCRSHPPRRRTVP